MTEDEFFEKLVEYCNMFKNIRRENAQSQK